MLQIPLMTQITTHTRIHSPAAPSSLAARTTTLYFANASANAPTGAARQNKSNIRAVRQNIGNQQVWRNNCEIPSPHEILRHFKGCRSTADGDTVILSNKTGCTLANQPFCSRVFAGTDEQ
jgi:hypothetical protein